MRIVSASQAILLLALAFASALSIPHSDAPLPEARSEASSFDLEPRADSSVSGWQSLEKRRGGGGGGRGGGSGGGSSGGGSGSSGSSGGGGRGGSGSTSVSPSFGGGRSFAGGSSSSYVAGSRSPGGITPALIGGAALGFAAGALLLYGAYEYDYATTYPYNGGHIPVRCFCSPYNPCGCDDTGNQTLITQELQNSSVANITNVNGSNTVVIDGTLPNGTTSAGASFIHGGAMDATGYWVMAVIVAGMVWGV